MSSTSYVTIYKSLDFYNEIYDIFHTTTTDKTISDIKLLRDMPLNLKTNTKLVLFKTFGEDITEEMFVELLMFKTNGADFLNLVYIIKYFKLELDGNGMPIWTDKCPYVSFRHETVNNWYIWNILTNHFTFSKYMDDLLEFTLQTRLEDSIFPLVENFKQDLYFQNINIVNECNEAQHEKDSQKILDAEKIALNKMQGNMVISLYTNAICNVTQIKTNIRDNLYNNIDNSLTILLEKIHSEYEIPNEVLKLQVLMTIRKYFNVKHLKVEHRRNISKFKQVPNYLAITAMVTKLLDKYLLTVNKTINAAVKDNKYLACYKSTLLDVILSSCLNDFNFRQDYLKTILIETLVDSMESDLKYIDYIQTEVKISDPTNYKSIVNGKIISFNELQVIANQFKDNTEDLVRLFALKVKSLKNSNDKVITLIDILRLFDITIKLDKIEFRKFLNSTCNIKYETTNKNIRISWKQLQQVIFNYNKKTSLQAVLMLYYTEVDTIYEMVVRRIQEHSARLICTKDNYNNYMSRIHKKFNKVIIEHREFIKKITVNIKGLSDIICKLTGTVLNIIEPMPKYNTVVPPVTVTSDIIGFKLINMQDIDKLNRGDYNTRVININEKFNELTEPELIIVNSEDEDSASDIDEIE